MSTFIKSDYISANASINNLESLKRTLSDYADKLNSCIDEAKSKISSSSFDVMFARLRMHADVFKNLSETISQISSNAKISNSMTSDSMRKYGKLTDQELAKLKRRMDIAYARIPSEKDVIDNLKYKLGNKNIMFKDYATSINNAISVANSNYNDYKEALQSTKDSDRSGNAKLGNFNTKLNNITDVFSVN